MSENNIPHIVDTGASMPKCESCNKNQAQKLHTCPFAEEIHGDTSLCNCCDICENECCQSI